MKNFTRWGALVVASVLTAMPALAQEAKKPPKPAPSLSQAVLESWNDIGRKLIAIAEDLPEDKYDYKPNPESRTFLAQLIHASASMYYFTDIAEGKKPRYPDDPKREDLKLNNKEAVVAFVKECVKDGADVIKAKGDSGMTKTVVFSGQTSRISDLAYGLIEHSGEHYGQLVVYYRINGIVPPESRPKK
ncbi:MAG TPA: DinB family protein [Candidatus Methylomirabilis sp.]|nr:DinB family protein [Candidatus Methylomirabilis sp.]